MGALVPSPRRRGKGRCDKLSDRIACNGFATLGRYAPETAILFA
jgi:hypothetical protein